MLAGPSASQPAVRCAPAQIGKGSRRCVGNAHASDGPFRAPFLPQWDRGAIPLFHADQRLEVKDRGDPSFPVAAATAVDPVLETLERICTAARTRMIPVRAAAQCLWVNPPVHGSMLDRCSRATCYQRERPRSFPRRLRAGCGLALSTLISRSSTCLPFKPLMACWAACSVDISTKAKPLDRPV